MASARRTRDHDEIREWVEENGGRPAQVEGTGGMLRIDFGEPDERLEPIEWERFFELFDQSGVDFLYDPTGHMTKFVRSRGRKKTPARKTPARKTSARKTGAAKKSTAKRSPAKKSATKKSAAKRSTAKKSTAKKSTATSAAKRVPAKKSSAKKSSAKKSSAKKTRKKR